MFDFLFNPKGRISRKGWWLGFMLPYLAITIGLSIFAAFAPILALLSTLASLFYLWPSVVAVPVKRFHDLGMSGFWQLGFLVAEIVLTIGFFMGVGMYAAQAGLEQDFANLGSLPSAEQGVVLRQTIGGAFGSGNVIVIASTALLLVLNLAWFYFQGLKRGELGDNKYAVDPLASGHGYAD